MSVIPATFLHDPDRFDMRWVGTSILVNLGPFPPRFRPTSRCRFGTGSAFQIATSGLRCQVRAVDDGVPNSHALPIFHRLFIITFHVAQPIRRAFNRYISYVRITTIRWTRSIVDPEIF